MSEHKLVSPLLDGFIMGNPMSTHDGISCCPAMKENTDEKYIVKIISIPESQVQLDALLLTGAYRDPAEATDYFKDVADSIAREADILNELTRLEGFVPYEGMQIIPMEDGKLGYHIYLLSTYKRSLLRHMKKKPITHLEAVNLGLDLCAALAICRRAGYLYVNLKPSNVFLSKEKQYRIGDLGFVKLDSLAYTSLPGKYRSPYAPAEVQDDMKTLNETVDTYAVGMILYQIFNEGSLPAPTLEPTDSFPHPANADYELSAIIMKALDPDPAKRWADPMEMGQALVAYMQRNTVNNTPIVPPSAAINVDFPVSGTTSDTEGIEPPVSDAGEPICAEPEEPDFLQENKTPVVPEGPAADDTEKAEDKEADDEDAEEEAEDLDFSIAFMDLPPEPKKPAEQPAASKPVPVRKKHNRSTRGILTAVIVLLILALLMSGGYWFYQTQYLKNIDNLTVDGTQNLLTVTVETDMDMSLLQVTCTDTYGNTVAQPLVNGQSVFTDLLPDSLYRIELTVDGFHQLTGKTAEIFTTDALTNVISMTAVTGPVDGSVLVNFTVDGADPEEWVITCSADGEEDITEVFTGHTVTVKGLTIDKLYTLTLGCTNGEEILGNYSTDFLATELILAENLTIVDCIDGVMTIRWDTPANADVEKWNVRCYNDAGHEEALEISGTEIAFTGIDITKEYTVEVTAKGMTQSNRVTLSANPLTVTNLSVAETNPGSLTVTWTYEGTAPEDGWLLLYTLDGIADQQNVVKCKEPSAVIEPRIPSAEYTFTIQAADATSVFNSVHKYVTTNADVFTNEGLSADKISAHLLKTPDEEGWTIDAVGTDAYTDTFLSGESISIVLTASDNFYLPEMDISVMYVIRDGNGNVLSKYISQETRDWKALWYEGDYHNGELTIPEVPEEPGNYSVSVYFNNLAVTATNFTISQ